MARIAASHFLGNEGKAECIISNAAAAKMKHNAELIFIGCQFGLMLVKTEMFKPQPIRSKILSIITRISDIRIILLNLPDKPGNRLEFNGIFKELLKYYALTNPKLYKITGMKKYYLPLDQAGY